MSKGDAEQVSKEERVPLVTADKIEMLARQAALSNDVDPEVAMQLARLIFATAAVANGQAIAKITLKIHDTSEDEGRLRAHGKYGVCLACIKVDTQIGHLCASIAPGSSRCCLLPDSLVRLNDGSWRRAGDLEVGDRIQGFESQGERVDVAVVSGLIKNHLREDYYVLNGALGITGDHPVMIVDIHGSRAWRRVDNLSVGDMVFSPVAPFAVDSIVKVDGPQNTVYVETDSAGFAVRVGQHQVIVNGQYLLPAVTDLVGRALRCSHNAIA